MLIDCNKKEGGANYLEQIHFRRYDLKALLLLCRTYYQLKYYVECLKGYLHLLDLDSGTSTYSIIAHYEIGNLLEDMLIHPRSLYHY